jgi:redox-sensitive bicupin YhaK (pirin superfamily)
VEGGSHVRLVAGSVGEKRGPVTEIAADPSYMDVTVAPGGQFDHLIQRGHTAFAYIFEGQGSFAGQEIAATHLAVFGDGDRIQVTAGPAGVRFLLASGLPLGEPIARYGPFVMNTRQEIEQALRDLQNGTFVQQ